MNKLIFFAIENDLGCWVRVPTVWPYKARCAFDEVSGAYGHAEDGQCNGPGFFFADWAADELSQEITALARDEGADVIISPLKLTQMKPTVLLTIDDQQTAFGMESTLLVEPVINSPAINALLGAFAAEYRALTEIDYWGALHVEGLQGTGDWAVKTLISDLLSAEIDVVEQIIETEEVVDVA